MPASFRSVFDQYLKNDDPNNHYKAVFILHDQLNLGAFPDWIKKEKPLLVFAASDEHDTQLPYHKKRIAFLRSAMRHFAIELRNSGYPITYLTKVESIQTMFKNFLDKYEIREFYYMKPAEWDTREQLENLKKQFSGKIRELPNTFFMANVNVWKDQIKPGYRMEYF